MRGLPGSGKSRWVDEFIGSQTLEVAMSIRSKGYFSTDSLFYVGDEYRFDTKRLAEFHQRNLSGFIHALSVSQPLVICDNTNMAYWELMAYEAAAKALGYQVRMVLMGEPRDPDHQVVCAKRNNHNVPLAQIQRMAKQFEAC
ncbi:AAA family ATPase [Shewanella benthica]|nr:AAA family ATPase [Shewanella benthica]